MARYGDVAARDWATPPCAGFSHSSIEKNTDFELRYAIRVPLLEHPAHDQIFVVTRCHVSLADLQSA